jgi:hypothetical protein
MATGSIFAFFPLELPHDFKDAVQTGIAGELGDCVNQETL